jgi:hypothetical protein
LQKKTLIQHAHSLVLAKENVQLNFHIQQRLQLKALLPFLSVKSYGYLLNLKNSLLQFKEKLNPKIRQNRLKTSCPKNFYILHPIKGGFRAYVGATLGFLARRQLRKIFKLWVKRQNTKQRTLIKARRNLRLNSRILPQPLNIKLLKEFKVQSKFRAAYKKKKFAAAKTKQLRKIVHSKIQFTFTFFRENAWAERQVKRKEKRKEKRQAEGLSNYKRRRK